MVNVLESAIGIVSPQWALKRAHARRVLRTYQGAEANRLTNHKRPKNLAADQELLGPFGADALRAWARALVRDNAYAWGVVDTIVSSVVGTGITAQSILETPDGDDIEEVNDQRDQLFAEWCEVCEVNGQMTFAEIQALVQREIIEAGEVLVRFIKTPSQDFRGIYRPVPLALELIEADRLASDRDTYSARQTRASGNRIVRGVELDDKGQPVAYWIYRDHPNAPYTFDRTPERVPAIEIRHLFRQDRIGQTRGVSWFAPVMSWLRDLGVYVDNEIQASAVASCFGVAIKTETPIGSLAAPSGEDSVDGNGNTLEYLEPAMVTHLKPGESIETINPGRPNSASEPWINLMLRGIAVGTGLSYEIVARDYSKTNYSSSRSSQLEDRRRFRRWQQYLVNNLCQPVRDEFSIAAALVQKSDNDNGFPTATELLESRRRADPVAWQTPSWEWVDPQSEQTAAESGIKAFMSTLQDELGSRGRDWRQTLYQSAKERKLRMSLGLLTAEEQTAAMMAKQTETEAKAAGEPQTTTDGQAQPQVNVAATALNGAQVTSLVDVITQVGTGAMPHETAKAVLAASFPLIAPEVIDAIIDPIKPGSVSATGEPTGVGTAVEAGSSEWMGLSRLQWNRNRKALEDVLSGLTDGTMTPAKATAMLATIGLSQQNIDALIADASDGSIEQQLPPATDATVGSEALANA